ncbi:MAG: hypothetical protein SGJ11_15465, partial [Phycisphaerae bacterium]|nr:hypothetical protein [Phycisphaerae bacterium]
MVVRDGPGLSELTEAIRRTASDDAPRVSEVNDIFEALAEVAATGADDFQSADRPRGGGEAVVTVAVTLRSAGHDPALLRDAFRRLNPRIRLMLSAVSPCICNAAARSADPAG